ncbi:MAG: cupin domain-containing protein, partial [Actinomycetota bacterium]
IGTGAAFSLMKATAESTAGGFSMAEVTFPAGMSGPPPHLHRETTDTFYVLEGTLRVHVGTEVHDLPAGSFASVPPGVVHTFSNPGEAAVRFLNINCPGGWERYLRDLAKAMSTGVVPGSAEFAAIVAPYDFEVAT